MKIPYFPGMVLDIFCVSRLALRYVGTDRSKNDGFRQCQDDQESAVDNITETSPREEFTNVCSDAEIYSNENCQ